MVQTEGGSIMYNLETGKTVIELYDGEIDAVLDAINFYIHALGEVAGDDGVPIMKKYANLYDTILKQKEEAK